MKSYHYTSFCAVCFGVLFLLGCQQLELDKSGAIEHKRNGLSESNWNQIAAQDLAIVMPRSKVSRISITQRGESSGRALFEPAWMEVVQETFAVTDVRGALNQNQLDDWQIVSIRIDPCSPIGKIADETSIRYCWPEVRIVWQPIVYNYNVGWTIYEAFADDRAIHTTYRVHVESLNVDARYLVSEISDILSSGMTPSPEQEKLFVELRQATVRALLADTMALRDPLIPSSAYREIEMRAEMQASSGMDLLFIRRLKQFLERFTDPASLHALTAFSLPPGRDPEGINSWVFLSFKNSALGLVRTDIQVASGRTGRSLLTLTHNETVAAGEADFEVKKVLETNSEEAAELRQRVLLDVDDRARLHGIVNDPRKTLIANTTCSTCHSFNEHAFDFHNLSYLSDEAITIAPRVRNEVRHNIQWLLNQR